MPDDTQPDPYCAICERRLLPGERSIDFVTGDGLAVAVCELCKPRAEASGWMRPDEYASTRGSRPARDRRRSRGAGAFGGLISRLSGPAEAPPGEVDQAPPPAMPAEDLEDEIAAPDVEALPPIPAATGTSDALYAFNHSDHRRTVAGLSRTLGPPRASAIEITNGGGIPAIRLTIAWELTWYQWEVSPKGRSHEVRESGKGETIDQLREADRNWNLMVDADGTLHEKSASSAVAEE